MRIDHRGIWRTLCVLAGLAVAPLGVEAAAATEERAAQASSPATAQPLPPGVTIEIGRGTTQGSVDALVTNALLGELAPAVEAALEIEVELASDALAEEFVTDVRFEGRPEPEAIAELFRGFAYVSFVRPDSGRQVVKLTSVKAANVSEAPTPTPVEPSVSEASEATNLDAFRSLRDLEDAVEQHRETTMPHLAGESVDEYEDSLRAEELAEVEQALREARTERAIAALGAETGSRVKADAIGELADTEDARATTVLAATAQNSALPPTVRQYAIETLIHRGAESGYQGVPIEQLLESLSSDEDFAVSSTAQRWLPRVRRAVAAPPPAADGSGG